LTFGLSNFYLRDLYILTVTREERRR